MLTFPGSQQPADAGLVSEPQDLGMCLQQAGFACDPVRRQSIADGNGKGNAISTATAITNW